jgi:cell shape-determining protein MreD
MPATPTTRRRFRPRWLLLTLPYLALCFPQLYARNTPVLLGFPFFYWYQFAWVVLTSCLLLVYYKLETRSS